MQGEECTYHGTLLYRGVIQELADFVGDSLALAQKAATTDADIIVMCGVTFMGETIKSYVQRRQYSSLTLTPLVRWQRVVQPMSLRSCKSTP